jgi:hypothetical protein
VSDRTSWRVRLTPDDVPTATFTALRLAPRSLDGRAWVITAMPEPDPEPWVDPQLWDARQRLRDGTEAWLLTQYGRRPTGQPDR